MKLLSILHTLALGVALVPCLSSCISDDSVGANKPLSLITAASTVNDIYNVDSWDTLRIAAPEVTQANTPKPLKYQWEVNGKVVSNEKDLSYVCKDYGSFLCRLKISNEDATYYKQFRLNVQYAYRAGLYAVAASGDSTQLAYIPLDGRQPESDIFAKNNPGQHLSAQPQSISIASALGKQQIFVSIGSPSRIYKLDGNTMSVVGYNDGTKTASFLWGKRSGRSTSPSIGGVIYVIEDGTFASVSNSSISVLLTNFNNQNMTRVLGQFTLAPEAVSWARRADEYYNGTAFYDNKQGRFIAYAENERDIPKQYRSLFPENFAGKRLIGMGTVDNYHEIAMLLKDTATSTYYHVWIDPGAYDANSKTRNADPELKYIGAVPATAGVKDDSKVVGIPSTNLMYYSSGNALYAYSVLSKGNFPTTPTLTCDSGEQISSLVVSTDDQYLYVAANNPTTKVGHIYCFDLNKRTRVWKKSNVSGMIQQLALRN